VHVLGIDAGGSKTVALLADATGAIIGEGRAGGANLQTHGELAVEKALHESIEAALADRSVTLSCACLGMAGVDREGDLPVLRHIFRRLGFRRRLLIVNDALIALVAGSGEPFGLVLIAGTGSIAYAVNRARVAARSGGWGHVLGDEGSGYWIGRRALIAVMRAADGRGPRTALTGLVLRHFNVPRVDGLVSPVYDATFPRPSIAALGEKVEEARAAGDVVAEDILRGASMELVSAAASVVDRLEMRGDVFPTWLAGGMFRAIPWLVSDVAARLKEVAPRTTAALLRVEPAVGAVRLAIDDSSERAGVPRYLETPPPDCL
jgi:N-acetylglucosamine kinase-like BadF-type ATPase